MPKAAPAQSGSSKSAADVGGIVEGATSAITSIVGAVAGGVAAGRQQRYEIRSRRSAGREAHAIAAQRALAGLATPTPWGTIAIIGGGTVVVGGALVMLLRHKRAKEREVV